MRCQYVALLLPSLLSLACERSPAVERSARSLERPARPIEVVVEPDHGVVLERDSASSVLRPCSRDFPSGLTGYWHPERHHVLALEAALPRVLLEHLPPNGVTTSFRQVRVYRQYVGMFRDEVPVIYVNGMPASFAERHHDRWRTGQVQVCDGGSEFFGVVYTPSTGRFDSFAANGQF